MPGPGLGRSAAPPLLSGGVETRPRRPERRDLLASQMIGQIALEVEHAQRRDHYVADIPRSDRGPTLRDEPTIASGGRSRTYGARCLAEKLMMTSAPTIAIPAPIRSAGLGRCPSASHNHSREAAM